MTNAVVRCALSCALVLVSLAACASSITVGADHDKQADFSGWRTWAFATPASTPSSPDSILDRRIRSSVEKVMAERGFARAPAESADFLVGHKTQAQQETRVMSTGYDPYWGGGARYRSGMWGGGGSVSVIQYDVGTLFLDLIDRGGGFVAWRGHASATLDDSLKPEERDARVDEAVRKMLALFPPKAE